MSGWFLWFLVLFLFESFHELASFHYAFSLTTWAFLHIGGERTVVSYCGLPPASCILVSVVLMKLSSSIHCHPSLISWTLQGFTSLHKNGVRETLALRVLW